MRQAGGGGRPAVVGWIIGRRESRLKDRYHDDVPPVVRMVGGVPYAL